MLLSAWITSSTHKKSGLRFQRPPGIFKFDFTDAVAQAALAALQTSDG
jgi:hypothetical protein